MQFKTLHFKKGALILSPGELIPGVYYLKRGFVRLYTVSAGGEELTLIIFKKGDVFPIGSVLNVPVRQSYYLEALTSCELRKARKEDFSKFIKSDPEVLLDLASRLAERLGGMLLRSESFVFGDASQRISSILLICAERFGKKVTRGVVIEVPLTQSAIASLIGVARETASIELKKLEKKGIIAYIGRLLLVKNISLLKKASLS